MQSQQGYEAHAFICYVPPWTVWMGDFLVTWQKLGHQHHDLSKDPCPSVLEHLNDKKTTNNNFKRVTVSYG